MARCRNIRSVLQKLPATGEGRGGGVIDRAGGGVMSPSVMRVALIGTGTLSIPPQGWGAIQRGIWNHHQRSRGAGYESLVVNSRDARMIGRECERFAPDVVHLHDHNGLAACLPYLIAHPTPLVTTSHDFRLSARIPEEVAPLIDLADATIALSPSIRERIGARRRHGVHYVPNGVDTRLFRPLAKRRGSVLGVGNNRPRKRFAEIARFFLDRPEYRLTLCGPNMDVPRGRRHPVIPTGPNVTLLGNQPETEVARLLGEAEYFVHLCEQEASALVVREAMSCGCRVWTVPLNAQGLTNVARSWEGAVADADLGNHAAAEARESFDWSHIVGRHAEVYAQTVDEWKSAASSAAEATRRYRAALPGRRAILRGRLGALPTRARRRISQWLAVMSAKGS